MKHKKPIPNMDLDVVIRGLKTLKDWHWNSTTLDEGETSNAICDMLDEAIWYLEQHDASLMAKVHKGLEEQGFILDKSSERLRILGMKE